MFGKMTYKIDQHKMTSTFDGETLTQSYRVQSVEGDNVVVEFTDSGEQTTFVLKEDAFLLYVPIFGAYEVFRKIQ